MKDPIVGYDAEGKPFAVFCGECLGSCALVTPSRSLEEAIQQEREHCHPRCPLCGAERARNTFCAPCASAREQKDLETFFRRAKHVPLSEYDGRYCVAPGDDDFDAPDAWDDNPERPCGEVDGVRFVWGTEGEGHEVDLERECSENWLADAYEDASDHVDWPKIREAQKLVAEALSGITTYREDRSIAVILPPITEAPEAAPEAP